MEQQRIDVEKRTSRGKGAARRSRAQGKIPAILYGHQEAAVALSVNPVAIRRSIRASGLGRNTLFELNGLDRTVLALLKDAEVDPVRRDILHVDFLEVREGDMLEVDVPIEYTGKAEGVVQGGELHVVTRSIRLEASPMRVPRLITADITKLAMGDALHISDLALPEGTRAVDDVKSLLISVRAPRAEAAETAVEAVEGAAAEGAAAPAAE